MTLTALQRHWSAAYVGLPPLPCWELVRKVYRAELSIDLPRAGGGLFVDAEGGAGEFDLTVFRLHGLDDHAGVVVEPGLMLHSTASHESRIERYDRGRLAVRDRRIVRYRGPAVTELKPASHINLVAHPFLTERGRTELTVPPGTNLAEMVALAFPGATPEQRERMLVRIGDHVIAQDIWHKVRPFPGTVVRIDPVPGKWDLRVILGIIVTVAAIATGQFYGAALAGSAFGTALGLSVGAAEALITGGIVLAGNLLINAFVPLPGQKKGKDAFSIAGIGNQARNDEPFPVTLGMRRHSPPYFGLPYMEIVGDDVYLHAGFIDGLGEYVISEQRIGETLITEYEEVQIETSTPSAPVYLTLYDHQVVPTDDMGVRLVKENNEPEIPVIRISARDAAELEIIVGMPGGLIKFDDDGDSKSATVNLRIRARLIGAVDWTVINANWIVNGKVSYAIFRSYRWTADVRGQYEVEITRTDNESDDVGTQDKCDWIALYAHRPEWPVTPKYPITLTAVRIKATRQLNGTLDSYNCVLSLVCPDWDTGAGTWITRETQNPASMYRYVLQGAQNAKPFANAQIDLVSLQEWHVYCEAKGLKYNRVHDFSDTLPNVLSEIAASGRAISRHDGVQWGVVIDKPRTVVSAHISAHNSIGFTKSRPSIEKPDAFMAGFADSTNGWNRAERLVPWPGFVGTPSLVEPLELPWETDPAQAWIETRRRQHEVDLRRVGYSVTQDIESLGLTRGSMVKLNHPRLTAGQSSAHVLAVMENDVMLDASVVMETGISYAARFRRFAEGDDDQGASILRTVATIPGEQTALILTGTGLLPEEGDLVLFGVVTLESIEAIVKDITRSEGLSAQISLVPHAPEIEALTDAEVPPPWSGIVGEINVPPVLVAPAVPIITDIESATEIDSGDVRVSLKPGVGSTIVSSYDVQHRLQGAGSWNTVSAPAGAGAVEFGGYALPDIMDIQGRAIGLTGLQSAYTDIEVYEFGANDLLPPDDLTASYVFEETVNNYLTGQARATWTAVDASSFYILEIGPQTGGTTNSFSTAVGATEATSSYLSSTISYRMRIQSVLGTQHSPWSSWINIEDPALLFADTDTALEVDVTHILRVS